MVGLLMDYPFDIACSMDVNISSIKCNVMCHVNAARKMPTSVGIFLAAGQTGAWGAKS
jgi:hypothetical protein